MKKLFKFYLFKVFIISILFTQATINPQSLTAEQIFSKVNKSVVVVLGYDHSNKIISQGSGVVINDLGYVVTNYHVLSDCERLEIVHKNDYITDVDIVDIDVEEDILILEMENKKFPPLKIGKIKKLKVGQKVYAIGSPMGFENTISEGIISGLRSYDELGKNYIQITASISSGSSGGAVVNSMGELIGISTFTVKDGQNLNFAIPIDEVLKMEKAIFQNSNGYQKISNLIKKANEEYNKGNYKKYIDIINIIIKKTPNNPYPYTFRADGKMLIGDFKGSIQDYSVAIRLYEDRDDEYYEPGSLDDAYYGRGIVKNILGDHRGAIKDFDKAIEMFTSVKRLNSRAFAKRSLGDYSSALEDNNKAIELEPNNWDCYYNRGNTKDAMGDYQGAIKDFNKAIELEPELFPSYMSRGFVKKRMGDLEGACLDWSKAGELGNDTAYEFIKQNCN